VISALTAIRCCWSCSTPWPRRTHWLPGRGWGDWKASLIGDLAAPAAMVMAGEFTAQADPLPLQSSFAGRRRWSSCRHGPGGECAHLQRHDDRPGQARAAVQSRRVLALNSLAGPFRGDQQCERCGDQHVRRVAALRLTAAAELLRQQFIWPSRVKLDVIASLRSVTARPPSTAPAGRRAEAGRTRQLRARTASHACGRRQRAGHADGGRLRHHRPNGLAGDGSPTSLERSACDIAWAKITTLGSSVVDRVRADACPASSSRRGKSVRRWPRALCGCCPRRRKPSRPNRPVSSTDTLRNQTERAVTCPCAR